MKVANKNINITLQPIPLDNRIRLSSINLINLPLDILLLNGIILLSLNLLLLG